MKPNIFEYATSELSQDAIICWLLDWAKNENIKNNESLHKVGVSFLISLLEKHNIKNIVIKSIKIEKQYKKIDVLCLLNGKYALIIEDKTNTKNHSGQLQKYLDVINKEKPKYKVLPIYFKTGNQLSYKQVEEFKYKPYLRSDILMILEEHKDTVFKNQILNDYYNYLLRIDNETKKILEIPLKQWTTNTWMGFFSCLYKNYFNSQGDITGFGSGIGYYTYWHVHKKHKVGSYIRIVAAPSNKITIKLESVSKNNSNLKVDNSTKNKFQDFIIKKDINGICLRKNSSGKSVTIIEIKGDVRKKNSKKTLDLDKTISNIESVVSLLNEVRLAFD